MTTGTSKNEAAIRDLIDGRARALRAKDAARIIAHYAPSAVVFDLAPPLATTGTDPDSVAAWLATWDGPLGYDVERLTVTVSEDVAFAHSLDHMHGDRVGEPSTDLWFRTTIGLECIDGRWLITHEHQSVPFAMDGSGRALLDLKP